MNATARVKLRVRLKVEGHQSRNWLKRAYKKLLGYVPPNYLERPVVCIDPYLSQTRGTRRGSIVKLEAS